MQLFWSHLKNGDAGEKKKDEPGPALPSFMDEQSSALPFSFRGMHAPRTPCLYIYIYLTILLYIYYILNIIFIYIYVYYYILYFVFGGLYLYIFIDLYISPYRNSLLFISIKSIRVQKKNMQIIIHKITRYFSLQMFGVRNLRAYKLTRFFHEHVLGSQLPLQD